MDDSQPPVPEPRGALEPPRRHPPTAVGVATPPPPRPPFVRRARVAHYRPVYFTVAGFLASGSILILLAPWGFARAVGLILLGSGSLTLGVLVWVTSGAAARWALWRRTRWIRKRQHEIGRVPRPRR